MAQIEDKERQETAELAANMRSYGLLLLTVAFVGAFALNFTHNFSISAAAGMMSGVLLLWCEAQVGRIVDAIKASKT